QRLVGGEVLAVVDEHLGRAQLEPAREALEPTGVLLEGAPEAEAGEGVPVALERPPGRLPGDLVAPGRDAADVSHRPRHAWPGGPARPRSARPRSARPLVSRLRSRPLAHPCCPRPRAHCRPARPLARCRRSRPLARRRPAPLARAPRRAPAAGAPAPAGR